MDDNHLFVRRPVEAPGGNRCKWIHTSGLNVHGPKRCEGGSLCARKCRCVLRILALLATSSSVAAADTSTGLVSHWKLDDGAGRGRERDLLAGDGATTYYGTVDELAADGTTRAGAVWTLSTYLSLDDFESYTDDEGSRIYQT